MCVFVRVSGTFSTFKNRIKSQLYSKLNLTNPQPNTHNWLVPSGGVNFIMGMSLIWIFRVEWRTWTKSDLFIVYFTWFIIISKLHKYIQISVDSSINSADDSHNKQSVLNFPSRAQHFRRVRVLQLILTKTNYVD